MRRAGSLSVLWASVLLTPSQAHADDADMAAVFARHGVRGTMVLLEDGSGRSHVHDGARAQRPLAAASTFKVPNTLIALEEGVASGVDHVFRWDGRHHPIASWNADQTLRTAFRVSCVWCYQQLAAEIGPERYRAWLRRIGYGTLAEPFDATGFWLDGSLRISAWEQVRFLRAVRDRSLPFSIASYDALEEIMVIERTPTHVLRGKTGWAARVAPQVGWFVGYVETARKGTWFFATNIDIRSDDDQPLRERLTREVLQAKGILP